MKKLNKFEDVIGGIKMNTKKFSLIEALTLGLLVVVTFILVFNSFQISQLRNVRGTDITESTTNPQSISTILNLDVIPSGIPAVYGRELQVSFDDVKPGNPLADTTIRKLAVLDEQISLEGEELERYIKVASQISCEYCCGAKSIIFENGEAACGCAHSYAMRGLAKYLIAEHGSEFSDDEILEELGKWKTLFFPDIMKKKAVVLEQNGIEFNYINLASNKYRGIEKGASGGMVGGC